MLSVLRSTVIAAPIADVWSILRDFNGHANWHPAVATSYIEDDLAADTIGAIRNFQLTSGERIRERLLSLSDQDHFFSYEIVSSEIPLINYVASVQLKPVSDSGGTFWLWSSSFSTPAGREQELAGLVAKEVYEAGFAAVRARLSTPPSG